MLGRRFKIIVAAALGAAAVGGIGYHIYNNYFKKPIEPAPAPKLASLKIKDKCIILIGAPASGKGTQAERIHNKHGFAHISTGDLLRDEIKNSTPIGQEAKSYMNEGKLVPDKIIFDIIEKVLQKPESKKIMFDGFPRNETQTLELVEKLNKYEKELAAVIYLDVKDELLVERAVGRRIHQPSGRTYHIKFRPPKVEGKDDVTGEPLIHRSDDTEEVVKKRLETFHSQSSAVMTYFDKKNIVHKIDGGRSIQEIWEDIDKRLTEILHAHK